MRGRTPAGDIEPHEFRRTVGSFATGVTVITSRGRGGDHAMTANSFTSLSLTPPLVLVCVARRSSGRGVIAANRAFAINILGAGQQDLARRFASADRPRGDRTFEGVPHKRARTESPLLEGAAAHIECLLAGEHAAGDHVVLVGRVVGLAVQHDTAPLVFHGGGYRALEAARE
jgi:flavin reductase (DIM6/NTAB) family NADH-FMN oxidoreductase RutF